MICKPSLPPRLAGTRPDHIRPTQPPVTVKVAEAEAAAVAAVAEAAEANPKTRTTKKMKTISKRLINGLTPFLAKSESQSLLPVRDGDKFTESL